MDKNIRQKINNKISLIVDNGDYPITEKITKLQEYRQSICEQVNDIFLLIDNAIEETKKGYTFCPACGTWYKNKAWEVKIKKETKNMGYYPQYDFGEPICMTRDIIVRKIECPAGHLQPYKDLEEKEN